MGLTRWQASVFYVACILLALVLALAAGYGLCSARVAARRVASASNLHSWGTAIRSYRDMKGEYPISLRTLIDIGFVEDCPSLKNKVVSPHVLRHTTAMHLLQSGVDISVIALWLGHESITTTHLYMTADLAMKEKALMMVWRPILFIPLMAGYMLPG